jgi:hypothetical protein
VKDERMLSPQAWEGALWEGSSDSMDLLVADRQARIEQVRRLREALMDLRSRFTSSAYVIDPQALELIDAALADTEEPE